MRGAQYTSQKMYSGHKSKYIQEKGLFQHIDVYYDNEHTLYVVEIMCFRGAPRALKTQTKNSCREAQGHSNTGPEDLEL